MKRLITLYNACCRVIPAVLQTCKCRRSTSVITRTTSYCCHLSKSCTTECSGNAIWRCRITTIWQYIKWLNNVLNYSFFAEKFFNFLCFTLLSVQLIRTKLYSDTHFKYCDIIKHGNQIGFDIYTVIKHISQQIILAILNQLNQFWN